MKKKTVKQKIERLDDLISYLEYKVERIQIHEGKTILGWEVTAKDKNNTFTRTARTLYSAYQKLYKTIVIHEAMQDVDKPTRGELLGTLRTCRALLSCCTNGVHIADEAYSVRESIDELLYRNDGVRPK